MTNTPAARQTEYFLDNASRTTRDGRISGVRNFNKPAPSVETAQRPVLSPLGGIMKNRRRATTLSEGEGSIVYAYESTSVEQTVIESAMRTGRVHTITERIYLNDAGSEYENTIYRVRFTTMTVDQNPTNPDIEHTVNFFELDSTGPRWGRMPIVQLAAGASTTINLADLCAEASTFAVTATEPQTSPFGSAVIAGTMITIAGHASNTAETVFTLTATGPDGETATSDLKVELQS